MLIATFFCMHTLRECKPNGQTMSALRDEVNSTQKILHTLVDAILWVGRRCDSKSEKVMDESGEMRRCCWE